MKLSIKNLLLIVSALVLFESSINAQSNLSRVGEWVFGESTQ